MDGAANHQYSDALYLTDPDGNCIEIYVDMPPKNGNVQKMLDTKVSPIQLTLKSL